MQNDAYPVTNLIDAEDGENQDKWMVLGRESAIVTIDFSPNTRILTGLGFMSADAQAKDPKTIEVHYIRRL